MFYLSKKGDMQYTVIVTLLLVLVAFVVVILLQRELFAQITDKGSDASCKTSIEAAARSKNLPSLRGIGVPTIRLDCPRKNLTIKKSEVVEGDKINQDKADQIIADAMLSCWKKIGAGKVDPFSNFNNKKVSYCLICDSIVFDDALNEFVKNAKDDNELLEKRSIKDITPFLTTRSPKEGQASYYEQLFGKTRLVTGENSIVLPGSTILVQMHKLEAKEDVAAIGLIAGGVILAAGIAGAVFTGGTSIVGALAILGTAGVMSGSIIYNAGEEAFRDCKECNAVGGITLLPSEKSYSDEIDIKLTDGNSYKAKLCNQLVN